MACRSHVNILFSYKVSHHTHMHTRARAHRHTHTGLSTLWEEGMQPPHTKNRIHNVESLCRQKRCSLLALFLQLTQFFAARSLRVSCTLSLYTWSLPVACPFLNSLQALAHTTRPTLLHCILSSQQNANTCDSQEEWVDSTRLNL